MLYNKSWIAPLLPRKDYWANKWVQWKHNMVGLLHCPTCIALDGCYFLFVNAPPCPHHEKCHCELIAIDFSVVERNATAHSKFSKFDPYLFNTNGMYWHGKEKLLQNGDIQQWMHIGCSQRWNDKHEKNIYLATTNWAILTSLVSEST